MAINTTFNARLTGADMPNLNNKIEQKTEDFKTEIKLAQLPSAASIIPAYARPMNPSFAPLGINTPYPSTSKSNIFKPRIIIPEATIQNDQKMYDLMAKHPNPLKAPKDFILYLSKWLNPAAQTRAPAVYIIAKDYIDKYVLMAEGSKPKKGLSRGEKAKHNRNGSKRPNSEPPKKPDHKKPTLVTRDQSGFPTNTSDTSSYKQPPRTEIKPTETQAQAAARIDALTEYNRIKNLLEPEYLREFRTFDNWIRVQTRVWKESQTQQSLAKTRFTYSELRVMSDGEKITRFGNMSRYKKALSIAHTESLTAEQRIIKEEHRKKVADSSRKAWAKRKSR